MYVFASVVSRFVVVVASRAGRGFVAVHHRRPRRITADGADVSMRAYLEGADEQDGVKHSNR